MKIPIIPDWCDGLPATTRITSREIIEFFGLSSITCVSKELTDGRLPEPIYSKRGSVGRANKRNKYWLLGNLRKLRKDMLNENN